MHEAIVVLDHEPHAWFLLRDREELLLDVHCSHGPVDYLWTMALNADEAAQFVSIGRAFLGRLAQEVQFSAPGVRGSRSPFLGRNLGPDRHAAVSEAIKLWRSSLPSGAAASEVKKK